MSAPAASPAALVRTYCVYQAASHAVFFTPIFFVFYAERAGLTTATVLGLQSYYLLVRAVLDLPLGALADRWSRRGLLTGHAVAIAAGAGLLVLSPTWPSVVVAETLFAIGSACKSGADSALLYDALGAAGHGAHYPAAESRAQAIVALTVGTTAIGGGLLAGIDLRLPYVATIGALGVAAALVWRIGAPAASLEAAPSTRALLVAAGRLAARTPAIRWAMALATFAVVSSHVYYYLQQPYLAVIGVPVALFGIVLASTKVVTAAVAAVAHRVDAALGPVRVAGLMTMAATAGLAAMSAVRAPWGAVLILSRGGLDGLWQPLVNVYLNRLVPSHLRATMLSAQNVLARLALGIVVGLLGVASDRLGLAATLAVAAGAAVVVGTTLAATGRRTVPR